MNSLVDAPGAADLRAMTCVGKCSKDTPAMPEEDLPGMLAAVPEWAMSEDRSCLKRFLVAKNFTTAMKFFEAVADIAEEEGHHPDLQLRDKRLVEVSLSTHPIRGVSLRDFVVASKINAVELEYSPKWLREREEEQQK